MSKIIYKNRLEDLLSHLCKEGEVYVPMVKNPEASVGKISFEKYEKGVQLDFSYPTTVLPPKELLLPASDILFSFSDGNLQAPYTQSKIAFGVSLEDLEGLERLRVIFSQPIPDKPFLDKFNSLSVIAIDHFSPPKDIDFDLYLQRISAEHYAAFAKSVRGRKWVKLPYFESQEMKVPRVARKKDDLIWDPKLPKLIEQSINHPVWDELAEICFGCGICSFVCPLCYCFEIEDEINLPITKELSGRRCRNWDSCMLSHFAETSFHNFRPELRDRIYNWYYHKFVRMPAEYGFPGCVDCNRCSIHCPAKINYRTVLTRLKKDDTKKRRRK